MRIPDIVKKCGRCEIPFPISNIKASRARDILIEYTPCPHCLYVKDPVMARNNKSGRCLDCSIPFTVVDHHAKGRCDRCAMKEYRRRNKNGPL